MKVAAASVMTAVIPNVRDVWVGLIGPAGLADKTEFDRDIDEKIIKIPPGIFAIELIRHKDHRVE